MDLYARALLMAGGSTARGVGLLSLFYFVLSLLLAVSFSRVHTHTDIHSGSFSSAFLSLFLPFNITLPRHVAVLVCYEQYFHPCSILLSRFPRFDVSVIFSLSLSSFDYLTLSLCLPVCSPPSPHPFLSRTYTRAHTRSLSLRV